MQARGYCWIVTNASIFFGVALALCAAAKSDPIPDAKKRFDSLPSVNEDGITRNGWKYRVPKSGVVVQVFNHMDKEHDGSLTDGTTGNPPLVPQLSITW
jgi:hypothetical protein